MEYPENEFKINARGLSGSGPRMMVKNALAEAACRNLRVIVSDAGAAADLKEFFESMNRHVEVQDIGTEFHVLVDLSEPDGTTDGESPGD